MQFAALGLGAVALVAIAAMLVLGLAHRHGRGADESARAAQRAEPKAEDDTKKSRTRRRPCATR